MEKFFDFISKNWLFILFGLLFVGVVVTIILQLKRIFNLFTKPYVELEVDSSNLFITDSQAQQLADRLLSSMDRIGNDLDTIKDVLGSLSFDDYKLVHNKFGRKKYFLWGQTYYLGVDKNLTEWFESELDEEERSFVKKYVSYTF